MVKWEYSVITINTEYEVPFEGDLEDSPPSGEIIQSHLKEMGADGWELVSFLPALPMAQKWKGIDSANPWMYHAVFKRQTED
ncbi:DUF4177 domain-containing protein [Edaphobacter paludis]|uniref:DUF4177 domain-containing protein n=1 Tax=Edaphobacter paludis TaxID=3035702 RepID=A0AAU7D1Z6_9BACT